MNGIQIESLTFKRKQRAIFDELSVKMPSGQFIGLLGPNGTGKSTLLRLIAGLVPVENGEVFLHNNRLKSLKKKEVARLISYMPQSTHLETNFTVQQVVEMGRYPHKSRFTNWSKEDSAKVDEAIRMTGIHHLRERFVPTLSGGERQLVYLAKVIAQDTSIILLDEPTSDLDIYHQVLVTEIIKRLINQGKTVLAAIHDINYSARICDQCMLIRDGIMIDFGNVDEVLTKTNLSDTFQVDAHIYVEPMTNSKQMIPMEVKNIG